MRNLRIHSSLLLAAALAVGALTAARGAEETTNSVKFSNPAQPGTLKVQMARGDLRIKGSDTEEVQVMSEARAETGKPRKDGLRVLTSASSFSLTEKDNVITLDALGEGWAHSASNFTITVPRRTNVVVQCSFGGDISCAALAGDVEINCMSGELRLDDVSGGLVVQTMNGEIHANITELHENKPLSFTSLNGEVVLRVPATARANLRFRTQNGSVLTDFPESALVTKTETSGKHPTGVLPPEARQAIREAGRVAVETAREVEVAMREAAAAAREGIEAARTPEGSRPPKPAKPAAAPRPPRVPVVPTITGGKLLTGTLNGGGPEISVATMNGDVTLRQLEAK